MSLLLLLLFLSGNYIVLAENTVLGCGGFIKSHVQIDFSKVVVKLLTKQGIIKDETSCAPNGYYFMPLYDNGDYILQLEIPPGWSFHPLKVPISLDGKNDICTQGRDINFVFKGFGIAGNVQSEKDKAHGPAGITVELKSEDDTRVTTTTAGGNFLFTPVYPGYYTITAIHSKWRFYKNSISITVTEGNTDLPLNSLLIKGFDVSGSVKNNIEGVSGVHIALFQSENELVKVDDCEKTNIPGFTYSSKHICHITTRDGNFIFPSVPNGHYYIVPFYKNKNIHFEPNRINFVVLDNSVLLKEEFEIIGFSLFGRILASKKGKPLPSIKIKLNNENVIYSRADGTYSLDKIKSGTYTIEAQAKAYKFDVIHTQIGPNSLELPDIFPSYYQVCGFIITDKPESVTIQVKGTGPVSQFLISSDGTTGEFCYFFAPGMYKLQVVTSKSDRENGVQFYPVSQVIEIVDKPVSGITFSQLKATINGKVDCLLVKDCTNIKVILQPIIDDIVDEDRAMSEELRDGIFTFSDMRPGTYYVYLTPNNLCWQQSMYKIVVTSSTYTVPNFIHNGYSISFISSHDTQLQYMLPNSTTIESITVGKGKSRRCLERDGTYKFLVNSCHMYEFDQIDFDTNVDNKDVLLIALKHRVLVSVYTAENYGPLLMSITINGVKQQTETLSYENDRYQLELYLGHNERAVLSPQSDFLYFKPATLSVSGENDCVDLGEQFSGHKGIVYSGTITPRLKDVKVTVETANREFITLKTDEEGKYKFPPLDDTKIYKIRAMKDSYNLVGPDSQGNFKAYKLAEIIVRVVDADDDTPLQGTLLSLSGQESYRSNMQTNENGQIIFSNLNPSQYFLRPMMKEYNFDPGSKTINVEIGTTVNILLRGKRIAYSAFGHVASLNDQPEGRITISAVGTGNCSDYSEEATSEINGKFRIRGLTPYCDYTIGVKGSLDPENKIERIIPNEISVESITKDIADLKYCILREHQNMDVLVKVFTQNPDHYKNLRLKVIRESPPVSVIHAEKIETNIKTPEENIGVLLHVPAIPIDGKSYSIALEPINTNPSRGKKHFKTFLASSSFKYIELELSC